MNGQGELRNCVLAVRVSSKGQARDGDSPESQIEQGHAYAARYNLKITQILTYLESANVELDLQPMQHVITYATDPKNDIQAVLIKSIDRFTRGGSTVYDLLRQRLEVKDVDLVDMHGVISNLKVNTLEHLGVSYKWSVRRPSRKAELLEAERANDEVSDILTRMIGSEIRYTQMGYWSREARYGYQTSKIETANGKRVILVEDPKKALIMRKMFELRAQGTLTDDEIATELNRMGFRTPIKVIRDKVDRTKVVSRTGGKPMTSKLLRVYITKTIYAGVNTEKWTNGKPVLCKFKGLVSIELFNAANRGKISITMNPEDPDHPIVGEAPKQEKFAKKNQYNKEYPYRKLIMCPTCHKPLLGSASRGRLGKYYPAYHCTNHGHYFRVRKEEFDAVIEKFAESVIVRPERVDEVINAVLTVWEKRQGLARQTEEHNANRRSELEAQIKVTVDKMKLISSATAIRYMEEDVVKLEQQIVDLETKKEEEIAQEEVDMPTMLTYIKYFMEHIKDLLIDHCNPIQKAQYLGVVFDQVATYQEIKDGTPEIEKIPGVNELFKLAHSQEVSLVRERGLEPPRLAALAPQTSVSTIPPLAHYDVFYHLSLC